MTNSWRKLFAKRGPSRNNASVQNCESRSCARPSPPSPDNDSRSGIRRHTPSDLNAGANFVPGGQWLSYRVGGRQFVSWKMNFKGEVCSSSSYPTEDMAWINEIDSTRSMEEQNFDVNIGMTDSRLRSTSRNNCKCTQTVTDFKRRAKMQEQKAQQEDRFLKGRRIAYIISMTISRLVGQTKPFWTSTIWWEQLWGMTTYRTTSWRVCSRNSSTNLKSCIFLWYSVNRTHILSKEEEASYHRLTEMVRRSVEQENRDNSFIARNEENISQDSSKSSSKNKLKSQWERLGPWTRSWRERETGKKRSRSLSETRKSSKICGKDPKGVSPSGKSQHSVSLYFRMGKVNRNPHVIFDTSIMLQVQHPKVDVYRVESANSVA